jgi:thiamine kinase-like enzyme
MQKGNFVSRLPIPSRPTDIDADWLTTALSQRYNGVEVATVDVEAPDQGTSTRVRVRANYRRNDPALPPHLFIKSVFENPFSEPFRADGLYVTEVRFYQELQPQLDLATPRWFYSHFEDDGTFVLIMEDLQDVEWGSAREGASPTRAVAVLHALARLHAAYWDSPALDQSNWIRTHAPVDESVVQFMRMGIKVLVEGGAPAALRDADRVEAALRALLEHTSKKPWAVLHGDPHIKNIAFRADSEPIFADWQVLRKGNAAFDVSYFLGTSVPVEDRCANERAWLAEYRDALVEHGAHNPPSLDELFLNYRAQFLYGLLMWLAVPPDIMQPKRDVDAYNERLLRAVKDLDTLDAIEELTA